MTHWVILEYNGKIYAGVDKLASLKDKKSELLSNRSSFVSAPLAHDTIHVTKLLKYKNSVICICGNNIPPNILSILHKCLEKARFNKIISAKLLLEKVSSNLLKLCPNSVFILGCGLSTTKSSIVYMCSTPKEINIQAVTTGYVNSEVCPGRLQKKPYVIPGGGKAMGLNDAEYFIETEITNKSLQRLKRVGRSSDIVVLKPNNHFLLFKEKNKQRTIVQQEKKFSICSVQ